MNLYKSPRSTVIGCMRKAFSRGPIAKEVRARALSDQKGPRGGKMQDCNVCGKAFKPLEIEVDHIDEVIPLDKVTDELSLDEIWLRINGKKNWRDSKVDWDNFQCLCKSCHTLKTNEEKKIRKITREEYKKRKSDG